MYIIIIYELIPLFAQDTEVYTNRDLHDRVESLRIAIGFDHQHLERYAADAEEYGKTDSPFLTPGAVLPLCASRQAKTYSALLSVFKAVGIDARQLLQQCCHLSSKNVEPFLGGTPEEMRLKKSNGHYCYFCDMRFGLGGGIETEIDGM